MSSSRSTGAAAAIAAVELVRVPLDFEGDAFAALRALRGRPQPFALVGRWAGGGALVGSAPRRVLEPGADPFEALDGQPQIAAAPAGAVGGGWFGYLGYGLGERIERLPPRPPRPAPLPDFHLAYYDHVLRREVDGRWWLEGLRDPSDGGLEARMEETLAYLRTADLRASSTLGARATSAGVVPVFGVAAPGHAGHRWAVAQAVERIAAGDLFQVNLGLRLEAAWREDPIELFLRAAAALRPAYGAVFATDWGGVVSLSPELFLRRHGREVVTGPIKGTVARPAGAGAAAERELLLSSAKDAAEHVMIVDLMRNDLGRVCEYGSVTRVERRRVEPHPGVWHLVSDVAGVLRRGVGDGDLLRAGFPPGSVTGAPKVQSLHLIAELEGTGRELYTGALGYASPAAGLELAVAIRTFELTRERVWLGAGGGIVADSSPDAELDEALAKAVPLIAAAGGRVAGELPAARRRPPPPLRVGEPLQRPDPRLGVMETVRVDAGRPRLLEEHLERLAASTRTLYGMALPAGLERAARAHARGAGDARLRVHAVPQAGRLRTWCETAPLPDRDDPVELAPVVLPGGLGAHKWRDRRLPEQLAAQLGAVPLIVDSSGEVLEAAWANVWVVLDGEHRTPAADGRLLPGLARHRRLDALRAQGVPCHVGPLDLDDLLRGEIQLTSSLRDPCPARLKPWRDRVPRG